MSFSTYWAHLTRWATRSNPTHKVRVTFWSMRHVDNWLELLTARALSRRLPSLRLKQGLSFTFHTESSEISSVLEVFYSRVYTPPAAVPPDGTVVDIGGNIGSFTVYAAAELVPSGRVITLEPSPECRKVLQRNLSNNGLANVELVDAALGMGSKAMLHRDQWGSGNASLYTGNGAGAVEVRLLAPAAILALAPRIDFLKVDCEGAEHCLVWETESENWRGVQSFVMEYHLGFGTGYTSDGDPDRLARRLEDFGFRVRRVGREGVRYGYLIGNRNGRDDGRSN